MSKPPTYKVIFKTDPAFRVLGFNISLPGYKPEKLREPCPTYSQLGLELLIFTWLKENPELGASFINVYHNQHDTHDELVVVFSDPNAALMLKLAVQP